MAEGLSGVLTERRETPRYRIWSHCALELPDGHLAARLCDISAAGAFVETPTMVPAGTVLTLHHPTAGAMTATVARQADNGLALAFILGEPAVTFALRVIAADMTAGHGTPAVRHH